MARLHNLALTLSPMSSYAVPDLSNADLDQPRSMLLLRLTTLQEAKAYKRSHNRISIRLHSTALHDAVLPWSKRGRVSDGAASLSICKGYGMRNARRKRWQSMTSSSQPSQGCRAAWQHR